VDLAGLIGSTQRVEEAGSGYTLPDGGVVLEALERDLIRQALARSDGNRTRAAALLGLTRDTLRYRMEKYGLD
jgi:DNA-binding NtrC family response regulator